VYGSLAMQSLTGRSYVTQDSDIDLLCEPRSEKDLQYIVALLSRHARHLPLDGEIVFPSGQAVAWKEWVGAMQKDTGARVLAKHLDAVALMRTAQLRQSLEHLHD
jgi:phosphoribosyl-dephospho-CoA transferase